MIKVNLVGSLNVGELVVMLERNGIRLDGFEDVLKDSGVYEFEIGSRGMLDGVRKNDEYMSLDEVIEESCDFGIFEESSKEEVEEYYKEFYCENYELDLDGIDNSCVFGVSYEEEYGLIFVNVEIQFDLWWVVWQNVIFSEEKLND